MNELQRALFMSTVCGTIAGLSFMAGRKEGKETALKEVKFIAELSRADGFLKGYNEAKRLFSNVSGSSEGE